ncbi:hypothetical protein EV426DRAFT_701266 [Tirmania nivea]|nr:hypothetical protein EV426DRAFT_701266 [Tirmania nivea]
MRAFTKGSIAQAHEGAQAVEDLQKTTAAEKARQAWQTGSKRPLQKGGVLYASKARAMVKEKKVSSEAQQILHTQKALTQLLKAEETKREGYGKHCTRKLGSMAQREQKLRRR